MNKLVLQKVPGNLWKPHSEIDKDVSREYKDYQLVTADIKGTQKQRSLEQLRLFWACCKTVADNTEDPFWDTKDKVAFQIKVALHFVNPDIVVVHPEKQHKKELELLRRLFVFIKRFQISNVPLDKALSIIEMIGNRLKKKDDAGRIVLCYRSISFKELPHMEACNFFDRAFEIMAKKIGITGDELLKNTEC